MIERIPALTICSSLLFLGLSPNISTGEQRIEIEVDTTKVGKYDKAEFLIRLDTIYNNPFDPDEIDLSLELKTPTGKTLKIPAFYYQHYDHKYLDHGSRKSDWLYPLGKSVWKARFAPMEVGTYSCVAKLVDRNGTTQSNAVSFECIASQNKGFVRVSDKDSRFLEFTEGEPFFPIGQNVAFIGPTQYVDNHKVEEVFNKMSQNGANFARIWTCGEDWAMAIEARKSAFGRSWDWRPPITMIPDREGYFSGENCLKIAGEGTSVNVSPSHPVALKPKTNYVVSGMVRADVEVWLEVNNVKPKEISVDDPKRQWTEWQCEFTTSPDEYWLHQMLFRLSKDGNAWLKNLSLKEAANYNARLRLSAKSNGRLRLTADFR